MAFAQLGSGNSLQMCGKVYAIVESTTSFKGTSNVITIYGTQKLYFAYLIP
jgi:hypothetical protein